jgi:hypothetical protein
MDDVQCAAWLASLRLKAPDIAKDLQLLLDEPLAANAYRSLNVS